MLAGLQADRDIGWLTYAEHAERLSNMPRFGQPDESAPFPDVMRRAEQACPTPRRASDLSFADLAGAGEMLKPRPNRYVDRDRLLASWNRLERTERLRVALFGMTERASAAASSAVVTREDERSSNVRTRLHALLWACWHLETERRGPRSSSEMR
ncbi:hypothetical protein [Sphingosinicella sp. BN140058]|uniref:hypothetical protein n=1 Tax=Sphingosinicella sp. BN140058 TaxID=1892855 RepID=UPI0010114511|nr:hypothetical protein [Sphingosinicella sp. BN140058]QAY77263.1 hypothetical protein ETR14_12685 [Sphingosinicella sp. BN140058]